MCDKNEDEETDTGMKQEQEEPKTSASMEVMKDMVPIMLKSNLEGFKVHSDVPIYASCNLDWKEFIAMFIGNQDPYNYVIKGDGNHVLDPDSRIGDYIDTFKRHASCYLVWVEEKKAPVVAVRAKRPRGRQRKSPKRRKRVSNNKSVTPVTNSADGAQINKTNVALEKRRGRKKSGTANLNSPTVEETIIIPQIENKHSFVGGGQDMTQQNTPLAPSSSQSALESQNGNSHNLQSKHIGKRKRSEMSLKPHSNNDPYYDSSEGESIAIRQKPPKPVVVAPADNIKSELLNFMSTKVSNRDMLRIRQELMVLRNNDNYFRLTSISPLTAGLLEQMLCRDLPVQNTSIQ